MSRLFVFLLGLLVGAFAVHVAYDRGMVTPDRVAVQPAGPAPAPATGPASIGAEPDHDIPVTTRPRPADRATAGKPRPTTPATEPPLAYGREPLPALSSDELMLPVAGVKPAQLMDTYTQSRGEGRSHDAIDIMAPRGTPVVAVADGRVAKLFHSKQGGLTVYQFDSGDNVAYYYAHLDSYADGITEGAKIERGDLIGYVGSTGNANPDGPHLHFAIFLLGPEKNWWQGTPINPFPLLGGKPSTRG